MQVVVSGGTQLLHSTHRTGTSQQHGAHSKSFKLSPPANDQAFQCQSTARSSLRQEEATTKACSTEEVHNRSISRQLLSHQDSKKEGSSHSQAPHSYISANALENCHSTSRERPTIHLVEHLEALDEEEFCHSCSQFWLYLYTDWLY